MSDIEQSVTNEISMIVDESSEICGMRIVRVTSFEEAGLLTMDNGFRITLDNGGYIDVTVQANGLFPIEEEEEE